MRLCELILHFLDIILDIIAGLCEWFNDLAK